MASHKLTQNQEHNEKMHAIEIAEVANEIVRTDESKLGVLLCEGLEESIDKAIYSAVYPYFVIVPSNGCSDIIKIYPRVCKFSESPVFAIIDRDSMSRKKMKTLAGRGIYATKLPFIENIICCPEILKVIARKYDLDYQKIVQRVKSSLTGILVERLRNLNPFDFDIPSGTEILRVNISIVTKAGTVSKLIDLNNVMYTFRNKMIVSEVATALGHSGKEWYYNFIVSELESDSRSELVSIMKKYLPDITVQESEI